MGAAAFFLQLNKRLCHGNYCFPLSDRSDPLVGFGLDAEIVGLYLQDGTKGLFYPRDMRSDLGRFRDDYAVYMMDTPVIFSNSVQDDFQ
jgi:hypothetical protein